MQAIRTLFLASLLLSCGCGGAGDGGAGELGEQVGRSATDLARGVARGVDTAMEVPIELTEEVLALELEQTSAKHAGIDAPEGKGITVYFVSKEPVQASLLAKALNADGKEIGRSLAVIEFARDDAQYVTFSFDKKMDSQLVQKYVIGVKSTSDSDLSPQSPAATDVDAEQPR
jgi:hypothetical protein